MRLPAAPRPDAGRGRGRDPRVPRRRRLRARVDRGRRRHALLAAHAALGGDRRLDREPRSRARPSRRSCSPASPTATTCARRSARSRTASSPCGRCTSELAARLIHSADERIPVDDLELGTRFLVRPRAYTRDDGRETRPPRRHGARERRARARPDATGRARSAPSDGELKVASGRKPFLAADVGSASCAGPRGSPRCSRSCRCVRRALPEARLPYERPGVADALVGVSTFARASRSARAASRPSVRGGLLRRSSRSRPPPSRCAGTDLAAYHGAEHIAIGSYEHGEPRTREHERCGSHLVGPLLATSVAGSVLANAAPRALRPRRPARGRSSARSRRRSSSSPGWCATRTRRLARALAWPGHELQQRVLTAEPTPEQLEVAEAALAECLRLESPGDGGETSEEAPPT